MFDCPVHGTEKGVFCFRAFAEENWHLWRKLIYGEIEFEEGELDLFLDRFRLVKDDL